jgi:beta-galactosidase
LHAQVFPRFYLELADEMGICVLDETAIWSSDGGPKIDSELYWQACRQHVKGLVFRDRNHPSVFGWSVCNETLPVTRHVFNAPAELFERNVQEINTWVAIARETDPTRSWISGDGETQADTDLPTVIGHYGGMAELERWSGQGKPWGIGETGMAYYGTPLQVSRINGDRAFESQLGRMEGLAAEAFDLISRQRDRQASFTSIFNVAWYGLKPLALGLMDTGRAPGPEDGIFFGDYQEGKPGVQPERLGPYTTTFNPGYDPSLPLYASWPLFDAVKAAFSDQYQAIDNPWDVSKDNRVMVEAAPGKQAMAWISLEEGRPLKETFRELGLRFESMSPERVQLIILDGLHPPENDPALVAWMKTAMENGSTLLVWRAGPGTAALLEALSQQPVAFHEREASSYLIRGQHPILKGESNASYYFTEMTKTPVSLHTLSGPWVDGAQLLLEACPTDWRSWNYQGEAVKTAKVIRNEREDKPPGPVMIRQGMGKGELIVSTLDHFQVGKQGAPMVTNMIRNMGGPFRGTTREIPEALDGEGMLMHANFLGTFKNDSRELELVFDNAKTTDLQLSGAIAGSLEGGRYWELISADSSGVFDLLKQDVKERNHASAFLSFWVFSPRSLTNLLMEPDMPRLDMHLGMDDALAVRVNGTEIWEKLRAGSFEEEEFTLEGIPLEKGWNQVVLQLGQGTGKWRCKLRFSSTVPGFVGELKSSPQQLE